MVLQLICVHVFFSSFRLHIRVRAKTEINDVCLRKRKIKCDEERYVKLFVKFVKKMPDDVRA